MQGIKTVTKETAINKTNHQIMLLQTPSGNTTNQSASLLSNPQPINAVLTRADNDSFHCAKLADWWVCVM